MAAPVKNIRVGSISLAIWENTLKDDLIVQSITIEKSYKQGEEWKKTSNFKMNELIFIQIAIDEALKFKYLKEDKPKEF